MPPRAFVLPEDVKSFLEQQIDQAIFISKSDHGIHGRLEEEELLAAVQECIIDRVVFHKRRRNAAQQYNRLPIEIWCMIWALLPPKDVLEIAHVCSNWRTNVIVDCRLWTSHAIVIDLPATDCDCSNDWGCLGADGEHHERATEEYVERNLSCMSLYLERSGNLPFHLDVAVGHGSPRPRVALRLAAELEGHTDRLATLHYSFGNVKALSDVFSQLGTLPKLQTLEIDCCNGDYDELELSALSLPDMPALHTLRFCFNWVLWDAHYPELCNIQTLTIPVSCLDALECALRNCRKLHTLEMTFIYSPDDNVPFTEFEDLASLLTEIRTVTLKYDWDWEDIVHKLALLVKDVRHLTLDFVDDKPDGPFTVQRHIERLVGIEHLGSNVTRFEWAVEGDRIALEVWDNDDRSRRVLLHRAYIGVVVLIASTILDPRVVADVTLDWSLLGPFLAAIPKHRAKLITTLTIRLPSSLAMNALIMDASPSSPRLSRLACLSFEAAQDAVVTASGVSSVVRAIVASDCRLPTLRFVRTQVLVDNDSALLDIVDAFVSTRDIVN